MRGAPNWEKRLREFEWLQDLGAEGERGSVGGSLKYSFCEPKKKKGSRTAGTVPATSSPPNRNDASTLCMYLCMYSGRDTISVYSLVTVQTKSELSCCLRCNRDMWRYIWVAEAQYFVSIYQNVPHCPAHVCLYWSGSFWWLLVFRQHSTFKSFCCWMKKRRVSV